MGKRNHDGSDESEPVRKKAITSSGIGPGDIISDVTGKEWKLGQLVGEGAFGEIFMASDCTTKPVSKQSPYVAKLELHTNGPLFVETHFYLRVCKWGQINGWKQEHRKTIGLPHYIASGSHTKLSTRYRFLILPKYSIDLQQVLEKHANKFNIKTVLTIALQLLDTLEYIHSCGFVHADIKASNILIHEKSMPSKTEHSRLQNVLEVTKIDEGVKRVRSCRIRRTPARFMRSNDNIHSHHAPVIPQPQPEEIPEEPCRSVDYNQVYLLDFGLASKYLQSNGEHKPYCTDARKAHAGTIFFCSLDAHDGVQSRRSDLESLGYNMVYWLTGVLPWMHNVDDYEIVKKKKQMCLAELEYFLHFCFGRNVPIFLKYFFQHIKSLEFDDMPDYKYCRKVFIQGFSEYGYKKVFTLDFENHEGWGLKKKRIKNTENERRRASVACSIMRTPLKSNLQGKHVLRKKDKVRNGMMRWSKILIDPELIIKSGKRKEHDECDNSVNLDNLNIQDLNPTETMLEVYNNYVDRQHQCELGLQKQKSNDTPVIEGYNATMMAIYNKILQRDEREAVQEIKRAKASKKRAKTKPIKKPKKCPSPKSDIKKPKAELTKNAIIKEYSVTRYYTRSVKRTR